MWDVIDFVPTTPNFWVIENIWWNLDYLVIIQKNEIKYKQLRPKYEEMRPKHKNQ